MKDLFEQVAELASYHTMRTYSTSFSLGTYFLGSLYRKDIYAIYGLVRFADEIVDTFHEHDKEQLLREFKADTFKAIERRVSMNPILHSFQKVVHKNKIENNLIEGFFRSMEADLKITVYETKEAYEEYIYGSAEVVGLMCLRVFSQGDENYYQENIKTARSLGAAFQKVNFLRDLKYDSESLNRSYFPNIKIENLSVKDKLAIQEEIQGDFSLALSGIKNLPKGARLGVYLAYVYYQALLKKIIALPPEAIKKERVRVTNFEKFVILITSLCRYGTKGELR